MKKVPAVHHCLPWSQVRAFRLARHHFMDGDLPDLVTLCADVCGIQAQVMAAAQIAFWARMHTVNAAALRSALFERRTLIRTSCMRQTLHILPSTDFSMYINALKTSRLRALRRIMGMFGITERLPRIEPRRLRSSGSRSNDAA